MSVLSPLRDLHGDLPRNDFDASSACRDIHEAFNVYGCDEERLIDTLGAASPERRREMSKVYEDLYGKPLKSVIKSKCSGEFGLALRLLVLPLNVAEAKLAKMAVGRFSTAEKQLYPIICARTKMDILGLKRTYLETYEHDLRNAASRASNGDFRKFATTCLDVVEKSYNDGFFSDEKARLDAHDIYVAFKGKHGNYKQNPFNIVCSSPPGHLRAINSAYVEKYKMSLVDAFDKELSGTAGKAATFTVGMKLTPFDTIATLINGTCSGLLTDSLLLTSCLVRYQSIIGEVLTAHMKLFNEDMGVVIARKTKNGAFRALLLRILNAAAGRWVGDGAIPKGPQCIRSVKVNIPPWAEPGDKLAVSLGEGKSGSSTVVIPERQRWSYEEDNDGRATCFFLQPIAEDIVSVAI